MKTPDQLFAELEPEVRDQPWRSNCAGQIFVDDGAGGDLCIGHFYGDAGLAAFIVAVQAQTLHARGLGTPQPDPMQPV